MTKRAIAAICFRFPAVAAAGCCCLAQLAWAAAACPDASRIVSVQGTVELHRPAAPRWEPARLDDTVCAGDMVRVGEGGRAALLLSNETTLRLDQHSTLTLLPQESSPQTLIDMVGGAINVISRTPRPFRVHTPFVNANIKGTEFLVAVRGDAARVSVFEGLVTADNEQGSIEVSSGEVAVAGRGEAPRKEILLTPLDSVQWALYVPAVMPALPTSPSQAAAPTATQLAGKLMLAGRLDEAARKLEQALALDPNDGAAFALQSVIALARNDKAAAQELADRAVERSPRSVPAAIAQSYVQQSQFRIDLALASARRAAGLEPGNALAWAQVAELELSQGAFDRATAAAAKAVELDPNLSRTQSVLGFASLTRIDTKSAAAAFRHAIELDSTDPLPRLGLGLAQIRDGDLAAGREQIEVAASLDPGRSLIRSYLGKAYYEEKRDRLVEPQLAQARQLDPRDPTPYLYDAIRKQTENRPVEALQDLEQSIALNGNRAVYRSQLLLDEDQAARQVDLARIYRDLGFEQLALIDAYRSLAVDPGNSSAHRLLADAYSDVERGDITRVSESLQAQLRQPLAIPQVDLLLGTDNLFILRDSGPFRLGASEFDQLFDRDRIRLQADAIGGSDHTLGDAVSVSGLNNRVGYSLSQLHYETNGFGFNDNAQKDIYDGFAQAQVTPDATVQIELKRSRFAVGETLFPLNPNGMFANQLQEASNSARIGGSLRLGPRSDVIWTFVYDNIQEDVRPNDPSLGPAVHDLIRGFAGEIQYLAKFDQANLIGGLGYLRSHDDRDLAQFGPLAREAQDSKNAYVYGHWHPRGYRLDLEAGFAAEFAYDSTDFLVGAPGFQAERHRFSPKLGLTWNPVAGTTLRAAAFSAVRRPFVSSQTIEPTQVAGFNQFFTGFDQYFGDEVGIVSQRACFAVDQKLPAAAFAGAELTARRLKVPFQQADLSYVDVIWKESSSRFYLYKAFEPGTYSGGRSRWQLATSMEYRHEQTVRPEYLVGPEGIVDVRTDRFPISLRAFHESGLTLGATATYLRQSALLGLGDGFTPDATRQSVGWVGDLFVDYRLPKRHGVASVGVKNLFDRSLDVFEVDPTFPTFPQRRFVYARIRLDF
jgi:tetratricopeptide (TPR) repeat protein